MPASAARRSSSVGRRAKDSRSGPSAPRRRRSRIPERARTRRGPPHGHRRPGGSGRARTSPSCSPGRCGRRSCTTPRRRPAGRRARRRRRARAWQLAGKRVVHALEGRDRRDRALLGQRRDAAVPLRSPLPRIARFDLVEQRLRRVPLAGGDERLRARESGNLSSRCRYKTGARLRASMAPLSFGASAPCKTMGRKGMWARGPHPDKVMSRSAEIVRRACPLPCRSRAIPTSSLEFPTVAGRVRQLQEDRCASRVQ